MSGSKAERSFTRFITPAILIVTGLVLMKLQPSVLSLSTQKLVTVGFGLFSVGAFSFVIILNHARNPLATEKMVVNVSQALVVYAGTLTVLVYEQIFTTDTMIVAVCIVLVLGSGLAVILDATDLKDNSYV